MKYTLHYTAIAILSVGAIGLIACGDQSEPIRAESGTLSTGFLNVHPENLATDVGHMSARVLLTPTSRSLIRFQEVVSIADSVSVNTDQGPVLVRIEHVRPEDGPELEYMAGPAAFDIIPSLGVWPNTWITVELDFDPNLWIPLCVGVTSKDGANIASWRFRPDSLPVLQRIVFCPGGSGLTVRFHISEPVSWLDAESRLTVEQSSARCSIQTDTDTGVTRAPLFLCPQTDMQHPIRIELSDLPTPSGQSVGVGGTDSNLATTVVPAALPKIYVDACTVLAF